MIVKSLSRGLSVLAAVNQYRPATVKQLVHSTRLPKPTLIRLLQSLVAEGYVESATDGTGYRVGARARRLTSGLEHSRYAEVTLPFLKTLGDELKFPSAFHLRNGDSMWYEASNRQTAPIQLPQFGLDRAPILGSAVGIAWLAALPEEESSMLVDELLKDVQDQDLPRDTIENFDQVQQILHTTRTRGYSRVDHPTLLRDLQTVAVAVHENSRPIGSIALIYLADIVNETRLQEVMIPKLRACARQIEQNLNYDTDHLRFDQANQRASA